MSRSLPARLLGFVVLAFLPVPDARAGQPWDAASLSAKPEEILRAVAAIEPPKDADVDILLQESRYSFDGEGRRRCVVREVIRFVTQQGVSSSASVEAPWMPWCEERPRLRARVITPDGAVHELDPRTIGDAPVEQEPNVWSDCRVLRAPLPAIRPGAVAETEVEVRETQPFFAPGIAKRFAMNQFLPVRTMRLSIEYPEQFPLRYEVRGMELKPRRTEGKGQIKLVFETHPAKPLDFKEIEAYGPPETSRWPEVLFSTGKSWNDVARGYEALVERQMDLEAVRAMTEQTAGKGASRDEAAARLLAKVRELVRYTGVEFGNAAIVPRSPRETLARRYGDCKDQSTLLVAMLRCAGFPAHVALIRTGSPDITRELPGLSEFNHAIVCVEGDPPLWIDPTASSLRAGQLPIADQGRWALVASSETKEPVKTPTADYRQNRQTRTIEYFLSEGDGSRVCETLEAGGSCEEYLRSCFDSGNEQDLRESWENHFSTNYLSKTLTRFQHTSAKELSEPFRVTAEADSARVGSVNEEVLTASLKPGRILAKLPYPLLYSDAEKMDRKAPMILPDPHVNEMRFRVAPPPGFSPRALPKEETQRIGPLTLSQRFEADGGVVTATFRLDTGPGTLTAAEAKDLYRAIRERAAKGDLTAWAVPLEFEHRGAALLREKRWKEGLQEYRQIIQQHPDRPEPRWRYAEALLKLGFGEAARQEARRAVDLAPQSAKAYEALAGVLSHDLLGRHLALGMDRPAALAAFRKSLELDPSAWATRVNYAILLEHNDAAQRHALQADLPEAIKQYREARKLLGTLNNCELNLAIDLFYVGDYPALETFAKEAGIENSCRDLLVAAVAAQHGTAEAQRKVQQLTRSVEDRRTVLAAACDHLSRIRLYPQSCAILDMAGFDASQLPALSRQMDVLKNLRRLEDVRIASDDPRHVVQQLLVTGLTSGLQESQRPDLFSAASNAAEQADAIQHVHALFRAAVTAGRQNALPPQRMGDIVSLLDFKIEEGDEKGYRVLVRSADSQMLLNLVWYVVREEKEFRLLASHPARASLGAEALRQIEAGNLKIAQRWLDWAWRDKSKPGLFNSFAATPFSHLWPYVKHGGEESVRVAAAALLAEGHSPAPAIPLLLDARAKASKSEQLQIDRALAMAYSLSNQPAELLTIADRLLAAGGPRPEIVTYKMMALHELQRQQELNDFCRAQLEKLADKPEEQEKLACRACQMGATEAEGILRARAKEKKISFGGLTALAWNAVCQDSVGPAALEDALSAAQTLPGSMLHTSTLVVVHAELGNITEALEGLRSFESYTGVPDGIERYALGRIAEHCGENDVAAALYRNVAAPKMPDARSVHALALRRLKKLGAASEPGVAAEGRAEDRGSNGGGQPAAH